MTSVGGTAALLSLARACGRSRVARVRYVDANGRETRREVEVLGLGWRREGWFFLGLCRLRSAYRLFKLDRVLEVRVSRTPATRTTATHFDARAFASEDVLQRARSPILATIRLILPTATHADVLFPAALIESQPGGARLCHLRVTSINVFAELVLTLGETAEPIRPPELVGLVQARRAQAANRGRRAHPEQ